MNNEAKYRLTRIGGESRTLRGGTMDGWLENGHPRLDKSFSIYNHSPLRKDGGENYRRLTTSRVADLETGFNYWTFRTRSGTTYKLIRLPEEKIDDTN